MRTIAIAYVLAGLASASAGIVAAPRPAPPDDAVRATLDALGPEFTRRATARFFLLSDAPADRVRTAGAVLDSTYDVVARTMRRMGIPMSPPPEPMLCVLIRDHARFRAFAAAQDRVRVGWIGGYYATHTNRIVFCDPASAPDWSRATEQVEEIERRAAEAGDYAERARRARRPDLAEAYRAVAGRARESAAAYRAEIDRRTIAAGIARITHEAAHIVAFNTGLQRRSRQYPFWMSEGFASCFEAATAEQARRGMMGPEYDNPIRAREFADAAARRALVPLEAFVEMTAAPPDDNESATVMYAQAYALFRWLYRYERERLAGLFMDLANEPPGYIPARRQGELFRARFGDVNRLERRWLRETLTSTAMIAGAPPAP